MKGDTISRKAIKEYIKLSDLTNKEKMALHIAINNIEAVDAEPVVRCEECKRYRDQEKHVFGGTCSWWNGLVDPEDYCSYGERMDAEEGSGKNEQ
ncbi:hypothetical protein [Christensenella intestinihominis]|uniref:hypothetical protein n=1 Tax=Christensenella intestinihominis TaxID=1851429 RepID=UPI0008370DBB|nr:hypothetical protein [Christensenella intestinihominis]